MTYLKKFNTESERQACTEKQEYVSYTLDTDKVNIHKEVFFCKLTLNNGNVIKIDGSGELTSAMVSEYKSTMVKAEIGDLCTRIGSMAFFECSTLTSVTMENSVTSCGGNAFMMCTSLENIKLSDNIPDLTSTFYSCTSLRSITIPNSTTVMRSTFSGCRNLSSVTLSENVTTLDNSAFGGCSGLTNITLYNKVTTIGNNVFDKCSSLTSITSFATTAPSVQNTSFNSISSNGTLYVPQGSTGYDVWLSVLPNGWTKVEQ